jgi:hypothetical protein
VATDDSARFAHVTNATVQLPDRSSCAGYNIKFNNNVRYQCNGCTIRFLPGHSADLFLNIGVSNLSFKGVTFDLAGANPGNYDNPDAIKVESGGSGFPPSVPIGLTLTGGGCKGAYAQAYAAVDSSGVVTAVTMVDGGAGCSGAMTDSTGWSSAPVCPFGGCVAPRLAIPPPANRTNTVRYPFTINQFASNITFENCIFKSTGSTASNLSAYVSGFSIYKSSVRFLNSSFEKTIGGTQISINTGENANPILIDHTNFDGSTQNPIFITGGKAGNVEISGGNFTNVTDAHHDVGPTGNAVVVYNVTGVNVHNINCVSPRFSCVRVSGRSNHNEIHDNVSSGAQETTYWLELGAEQNILRNNVATNGAEGISDTNIRDRARGEPNTIEGNTVSNMSDYCIHAEKARVARNHLRDCPAGLTLGYGGTGNAINVTGNDFHNSGIPGRTMAVGILADKDLGYPESVIDESNTFTGSAYIPTASIASTAALAIKSISRGNPAIVTLYKPGNFSNGQKWLIQNVNGMRQINGQLCTIAAATPITLACSNIDSTNYSPFAPELAGGYNGYMLEIYSSGSAFSHKWPAGVVRRLSGSVK